jgi:hypothetical protein
VECVSAFEDPDFAGHPEVSSPATSALARANLSSTNNAADVIRMEDRLVFVEQHNH